MKVICIAAITNATYNRNNKAPKTESCSTPWVIEVKHAIHFLKIFTMQVFNFTLLSACFSCLASYFSYVNTSHLFMSLFLPLTLLFSLFPMVVSLLFSRRTLSEYMDDIWNTLSSLSWYFMPSQDKPTTVLFTIFTNSSKLVHTE